MKEILVCIRQAGIAQRNFLAGVSEYVHRHGDWTIRLDPCNERITAESFLDTINSGIAGAIVYDDGIPELRAALKAATVPLVVFGISHPELRPGGRRIGFVTSDDVGIGRLAAEHFLSLGAFRAFGYVTSPGGASWSTDRQQGFRERAGDGQAKVSCFRSHGSAADRRLRLRKWLEALPRPAAVMAACDYLGAEVLGICRLAGIAVPRDISVIGVDNDTLVDELAEPALTSIAVNYEEGGRLAASLLMRLMRGKLPGAAKTVRCNDTQVVARGSTGYVVPASHLVTRALDFIRENAASDLKVSDVVRRLGVSRRLADLRFREFQNESINRTIVRIRLEEVRRKLLSTSLPVARIAAVCGFRNPAYLKRLFLRRYGETMDSFRR